jgi:hypothetical protein
MITREIYDYWDESSKIDEIVDQTYDIIDDIKDLITKKEYDKSLDKFENLEDLIGELKKECEELNDFADDGISDLYNLQEGLKGGYANYVVGNYAELKRQMEIAGFWKDEVDNFFESLIRFGNKL